MILIDLPMPEACDVCPFNYDFCWCNAFGNHDEWEKYSDDWNDHVCDRETRPEYCPLKEHGKKQITVHKRHVITLRRNDIFSMRNLYESICEKLRDEGSLIIVRKDDHEKVDFEWEIVDNSDT